MSCARCGREKESGELGWVTVLGSVTSERKRYCPDCLAKLIGDSSDDEEGDSGAASASEPRSA